MKAIAAVFGMVLASLLSVASWADEYMVGVEGIEYYPIYVKRDGA